MKHFRVITSFLLTLALLMGMAVPFYAAETDLIPSGLSVQAADGILTEVTFDSGEAISVSGAVDMEETERNNVMTRVESLEVSVNDEVILTVEPRDILPSGAQQEMYNGYYAITFALPGTTQECFLTGLSPEKVDMVQSMLIESFVADEDFYIEDVDFIDAEKIYTTDSNLCWAASTSDMLQYSGWGRQAGFETEDDIFDDFQKNFNDEGYHPEDGVEWFFNGMIGTTAGSEEIHKNYPNSGGYLNDYPSDLYVKGFYSITDYVPVMRDMTTDLRNGNAIGLSVLTSSNEGHAITLWGYVYDNSIEDSDIAHYTHLIISNSDDAPYTPNSDRRTAPNQLYIYPFCKLEDAQKIFGKNRPEVMYGLENNPIYAYTSLSPYSAEYEKETDERATKNKTESADLCFKNMHTSNTDLPGVAEDGAVEGNVWLFFEIMNHSDVDYSGDITYRVEVYRGEEKLSENVSTVNDMIMESLTDRFTVSLGHLDAGDYTAVLTVEGDPDYREAFYLNNTCRYPFTVQQPEYDTSRMSLGVSYQNVIDSSTATVDLLYEDIDWSLLSKAETFYIRYSSLVDGDWTSFIRVSSIDDYSEEIPNLPVRITLGKESSAFKLRLYAVKDGVVYMIDSPACETSALRFLAIQSEDYTQPEEIPYGSTSLNEGDAIRYYIMNNSIGIDEPLTVRYCLAIKDEDGGNICLTPYEEATLGLYNSSDTVSVTSFSAPLTKSTGVFALVQGEYEGEPFCAETESNFWLTVIEPGSNIVTIEDDYSEPTDGQTSLREAVAYCTEHDIHEIYFSSDVENITLESPLSIDSDIRIINENLTHPVTVNFSEADSLFRVGKAGALSLSGLVFAGDYDKYYKENVIECDGSLSVSDCRFTMTRTIDGCAVIRMNGGRLVMKNTTTNHLITIDGAIVELTGGVEAEMLNCFFYAGSGGQAIVNRQGRLNLINSLILSFYCKDGLPALDAFDTVNVINSVIADSSLNPDAGGKVNFYHTAYQTALDDVTLDDESKIYENSELFEVGMWDMPMIFFDEGALYPNISIWKNSREGCFVSEENGILTISEDNQDFTPIGVATSFSKEELSLDMMGRERRRVYGPYSKFSDEYLCGDVDGDEKVSVLDATAIQKYLASILKNADLNLSAANADGDSKISILDATYIQRYLASFDDPYPIGEYIQIKD